MMLTVARKVEQMQLIGLLIFIGILVLLLILAIYLARGEKSKNKPYGSWSNVLGPQFRGSAFDVGEDLKKEIEEGGQQFRKGRRPRHSKKKK
jgi:hypothetical protein